MEWPTVGVMIARGDLAVEAGWAHLAQVQEEILWVCEAAHVPVIWATQVLERLAKKGLPTRSEISDVVMAERAECVMLNKGPYITETIRTLDRILKSMQSYQQKKATLMPALTLAEPDPLEVGRTVGTREGRGWIRSI
jgi:pyruvate kinase